MKHLLFSITLLCLFVAGTNPAYAKTKPFRTDSHITDLSKDRIWVMLGHTKRSYKITSQTVIELDGRKAKATSLRKGMHADVTSSQIHRNTAVMISASSR